MITKKMVNGLKNYGSDVSEALVHKEAWEALPLSEREDFEESTEDAQIMNPSGVDEMKWKKAKEISKEIYGTEKWPFIMWLTEHRL
jgi:hypothetical protein